MIVDKAIVLENICIAKDTYQMELKTQLCDVLKPGQFIEIEVPPFYLRRPISICEIKDDSVIIIYKVVGEGTKKMSTYKKDKEVSIFGPCGNGFPILDKDVSLIGGGVGVPPLYEVAKRYKNNGKTINVILGFNTKEDIILKEEFEKLNVDVYIATMDGSYGSKGNVIDLINDKKLDINFINACGPLPMLRALNQNYKDGYISLESRMACGIGACMGCVIKDVSNNSLRVCKDGPVFELGKVII